MPIMVRLSIESVISFKEAITALEILSASPKRRDYVVFTTVNGDVRVLSIDPSSPDGMNEIAHLDGLPPACLLSVGHIAGIESQDIVYGALDNTLRLITLSKDELVLKTTCPLGSLPTAVCVANLLDDPKDEVVVATNDKSLRCYGWFDNDLDKLAHKMLEHPISSIRPVGAEGSTYSRVVFGDESGHLFIYQYADDRFHERLRLDIKGAVTVVERGRVTGGKVDDILAVTDEKNINLLGLGRTDIKLYDSLRASSQITGMRVGRIYDTDSPQPQILVCHSNSNIGVMNVDGRRLVPVTSIKTEKRAGGALAVLGDVYGDGTMHIVQAVGSALYLVSVTPD